MGEKRKSIGGFLSNINSYFPLTYYRYNGSVLIIYYETKTYSFYSEYWDSMNLRGDIVVNSLL